MTLKILLAEDQAIVRAGFRMLIDAEADMEVVAEVSSGEHAVREARRLRPDVVLMDIRMPSVDGLTATERLRARKDAPQVVVLTTYSDDESIIGALRAGALGYLTKAATRAEIGRAVHAAAAGQAVLDPEVQQRLLSAAVRAPAPFSPDGGTT